MNTQVQSCSPPSFAPNYAKTEFSLPYKRPSYLHYYERVPFYLHLKSYRPQRCLRLVIIAQCSNDYAHYCCLHHKVITFLARSSHLISKFIVLGFFMNLHSCHPLSYSFVSNHRRSSSFFIFLLSINNN